jgi:hypothetical protein
MNLSALSLAELSELQQAFAMIHKGVSILSGLPVNQGEAETTIDLTPGEVVIITTHYAMPGHFRRFDPPPEFVLVERETDQAADVAAAEMLGGSGDLQLHGLVESPPACAARDSGDDIPAAPQTPPVSAVMAGSAGTGGGDPGASVGDLERTGPRPGQVTGPLSDQERAEIQRLDAQGVSRKEIAKRLGRRSQTVALYLHGLANPPKGAAGKTEEYKAAQPAPVAEQASVADTLGADAAVEVPVAVEAAPVGEIAGGVARRSAPNPAPVAGGAAPFTARQRQIAAHVARLSGRGGFDAAADLALVEQLTSGTKAGQVALDLGLDSAGVVSRFRALTAVIRDDRDRVTIDGQADLLLVLRAMAGVARPEAA